MSLWFRKHKTEFRERWFRNLVEEFERPLIQYAQSLLRDRERAKDVVQDTFLRLWSADIDISNVPVKPWLYTVCRNRALDVLRKEKRMELQDEQTLDKQSAEAGPNTVSGLDPQLQNAMTKLSGNQQEIIRLKFQQDLSYKEIAEVLGLTVSNVGVQLHSALQILKGNFRKEGVSHE